MENQVKNNLHATRHVADSIFRSLFNNPERAVELYEMVSGEICSPDEIEICTLPDDSMLSRFNDVAFKVRGRLLFFFEHQSTPCPNMPVRLLRYYTDVLYLDPDINKALYGDHLYKISKPEFHVLYDGARKWNKTHLLLSDAFGGTCDALKMRVNVINCKELPKQKFSRPTMLEGFLNCMTGYRGLLAEGASHDVAVRTALDEAAKKDTPFGQYVKAHYKEVLNMLTLSYNKEAEMEVKLAESEARGEARGKAELALELLKDGESVERIIRLTKMPAQWVHDLNDSLTKVEE